MQCNGKSYQGGRKAERCIIHTKPFCQVERSLYCNFLQTTKSKFKALV